MIVVVVVAVVVAIEVRTWVRMALKVVLIVGFAMVLTSSQPASRWQIDPKLLRLYDDAQNDLTMRSN